MRFAAIGDVHGHFRLLERRLSARAAKVGPFDLLLQVGDLEPHRHDDDVRTMDAPQKYRHLGEFHEVRAGRIRLPAPLWFIGGNHEPWPFLDAIGPGGEAGPGVRFLGRAGVTEVAGLRIGGLSGIWKPEHRRGRPLSGRASDAVGFTDAEIDTVAALGPLDVLLLHDWPAGLVPEDTSGARGGRDWGNPEARALVELLSPRLVVCGHMHVPFRGRIGDTRVVCLPHVQHGPDSVAVFEVEGSVLREA